MTYFPSKVVWQKYYFYKGGISEMLLALWGKKFLLYIF